MIRQKRESPYQVLGAVKRGKHTIPISIDAIKQMEAKRSLFNQKQLGRERALLSAIFVGQRRAEQVLRDFGHTWGLNEQQMSNLYSSALMHLRQTNRSKDYAVDVRTARRKLRAVKEVVRGVDRGKGDVKTLSKKEGASALRVQRFLGQRAKWGKGTKLSEKESERKLVVPKAHNEELLLLKPTTEKQKDASVVRESIISAQKEKSASRAVISLTTAGLVKRVIKGGVIIPTKELLEFTEKRINYLNTELAKEESTSSNLGHSGKVHSGERYLAELRIQAIKEIRTQLTPIFRGGLSIDNITKFLEALTSEIEFKEIISKQRAFDDV